MTHNSLSAFHWRDDPRPSIFMSSRTFVANVNGKSASQTASQAVQRHEEETGRSRGTVFGISAKSDKAAEEFQRRIGARRRAA